MALGVLIFPRAIAAQARKLRVVALPHETFGVEDSVQQRNSGVSAQEAEGLEERHLLGQVALAKILALDRRFDARQRGPRVASTDRAHGDDADFAILVDERSLEHLHRAGRPDLGERGHGGDAHVGLSDGEHLAERRHRGRRLERRRPADRLEDHGFVVRPDEANELRATARRKSRRRDLEQHLELRVVAAPDPARGLSPARAAGGFRTARRAPSGARGAASPRAPEAAGRAAWDRSSARRAG